jgi:uncharacterized protein (TIGR04255 family)
MNEQALLFAPLQRIELDRYFIMLGDRNIVLSCKLPYPKWNKFKLEIFRILNAVAELNFSTRVERYSMKYVNILSAESPKDQLSKINLDIRLAGDRLETEQIMLRVEAATKNAIHISTIASGAEVTLIDGRQLTGIVVDIDSIRNVPRLSYPDFLISLKSELEELRLANKEKFFSCLTPETLKSLRPIYG